MRVSVFLLFMATFTVSANTDVLSQRVSIEVHNAELRDVFRALKEQTGHMIIYSESQLADNTGKVTLSLKEVTLSSALDAILKELPYTYHIEGNTVMIVKVPAQQEPQQVTVTGRITDTGGNPLVGATVIVLGTTQGVASGANGEFSLRFTPREGTILRFSFIGMKEVQVPYTGQTNLVVRMEEIANEIEQVVVTGYQTIAREKVTGAVSTITAEELGERYTANLLDNLEGRVAGLMVYNGGMQIRGTGSIYADRNPLLVIDGMPVEGRIEDINPYDIENITVLKDAAAAAIYGARASNGIIVITTKRAKEIGKVNVDVSVNYTLYEKRNLNYHDNFYMNPREQVEMEMKTWQNYFFDDAVTSGSAVTGTETSIKSGYISTTPIRYAYYQLATGAISQSQFDMQMEEYKNNNFAKEYADHILRNRFLQQYNVAVRNRAENFTSNLVLNYRHDNMGMINTYNDRFSAFYKGGYTMTPWLTINFGADMAFGKEKENNSQFAANPFNVPAYISLFNDDGSYNYYSASHSNIYHRQWESEPGLRYNGFNHLDEMENGYDETLTKRLNTRLQAELVFKVMNGVNVNTQFVYEADRTNRSSYSQAESYLMRMMRNAYTTKSGATYSYLIPEHGGKLTTRDTRGDHWTARGQLNFNRTFHDKHSIDFLAGLEFRQTYSKGTDGLMLGYDDQLQSHATLAVNYPYLESLTYTTFYGSNYPAKQFFYTPYIASGIRPVREQRHRYGSGYANLTYTYNNRYNLFASYRSDYADIYGLDTEFRGKPLWSVGASWNTDREAFMKDVSWINMLKLRFSYGVTGNIYQGATSFLTATTGTINSTTGQPISVVSSPANPELKWEQTATTNIGLDFHLLRSRVRGSVDWYYKRGTDIFANKLLEDSKGFASMAMNAASLKNNGIEVMLALDWFRTGNPGGFAWTTSGTFAYNKNKITDVDTPATRANQLVSTPYKIGYPVSALFSYRFAGISDDGVNFLYWKGDVTDPSAEDIKVNSISSSSPNIPEILVYSGQSDPKYSVAMENKFRFRDFSLNTMMVYYGGHKMRMRQVGQGGKNSLPYGPIDIAYLNSWTPDNMNTTVPGYGQYGSSSPSSEYQSLDVFVQSGDFLKIRNIVLGYDVPRTFLSKVGLTKATLNFQIDNPKALYIANDQGIDPETRGVRRQTSYIFGMNISF